MQKTYYPASNNARADWWQNIGTVANPILTDLDLPTDQVASIAADAAWGVYLYRTLRVAYEEATKRVIGYADIIAEGPAGMPAPDAPTMPTWPTAPTTAVAQGIESRRELWVQLVKNSLGYDAATIGSTPRIEAPVIPFNPNTYIARATDFSSPAAKTVRFKFSKAYGQIQGVNLYGRKTGAMDWINLGRFNTTPATATVPLANGSPEDWQFQVRAVKRDVEIGHPSPTVSVIVRS